MGYSVEFNKRVDNFFKDYQLSDNGQELWRIKINISKFIDSLLNPNDLKAAPRYIYLNGLGGIGKTYFTKELTNWINELIPNSVHFEDLVILSANGLEGDEKQPGAFLKVLQNQLTEKKRGSLVMIDEATWINDPSIISTAKRTFNNDQSKLSTTYFGKDKNGEDLILNIPPMLIFMSSNEEIKDPAVATRFDIINYPIPKDEAFINLAINISNNSKILLQGNCNFNESLIKNFVKNLETKNKNFRYITGNIEAYLLTK